MKKAVTEIEVLEGDLLVRTVRGDDLTWETYIEKLNGRQYPRAKIFDCGAQIAEMPCHRVIPKKIRVVGDSCDSRDPDFPQMKWRAFLEALDDDDLANTDDGIDVTFTLDGMTFRVNTNEEHGIWLKLGHKAYLRELQNTVMQAQPL